MLEKTVIQKRQAEVEVQFSDNRLLSKTRLFNGSRYIPAAIHVRIFPKSRSAAA
jgi:hypothetical protein